jgi:hypothetical protein
LQRSTCPLLFTTFGGGQKLATVRDASNVQISMPPSMVRGSMRAVSQGSKIPIGIGPPLYRCQVEKQASGPLPM